MVVHTDASRQILSNIHPAVYTCHFPGASSLPSRYFPMITGIYICTAFVSFSLGVALATFVTLHLYKGKPPTDLTPRMEAVGFDQHRVDTMGLESNLAYASKLESILAHSSVAEEDYI